MSEQGAGGSHFYASFLLLPAERKRAIVAVYRFLRVIDDAVDLEGSEPLSTWREELEAVYAQRSPKTKIGKELAWAVERYDLKCSLFDELFLGCEMDRDVHRYESFEELKVYCRRVAGAVGELCLPIFGAEDPAAADYADRLGLALQMTNILRDVGEDAGRGRIYLPLEDLEVHAVSEGDLLERRETEAVRGLLRFEGERATRLLEEARQSLPPSDRKALAVAEAMRAIYTGMLHRIRRLGYPTLTRCIRLPRWRCAVLAFSTWIRCRV